MDEGLVNDRFPVGFQPAQAQEIILSKSTVLIQKVAPVFHLWTGKPPGSSYGGKPILDFEGVPGFAELIILWSLRRMGWDGVWVDSYSGVYRTGYWDVEPVKRLPDQQEEIISRILQRKSFPKGAWDVFCWRGSEVLFVEAKRVKKDQIRDSQKKWLEMVLNSGFSVENFLIVEWELG